MTTDNEDDPLVLVFDPPLIDVLRALERQQGRALTETDVLDARDASLCVWLPYSEALKLDQARDYHDIDAAHVWAEWQRARAN